MKKTDCLASIRVSGVHFTIFKLKNGATDAACVFKEIKPNAWAMQAYKRTAN